MPDAGPIPAEPVGGGKPQSAWPIPAEDPYPALDALRAEGPVHRLEAAGAHLVVSHAEAHRILRSDGWSSMPGAGRGAQLGLDRLEPELLDMNVLFTDGDRHAHLRAALAGRLTPRAVAGLSPRIGAIVDAVLEAHEPREPWDVLDEVAYPVPLAIISELLDTGVEMAERLRDETRTLTALVDPLAGPAELEAGLSAATVLTLDLVALVAERRADPGDDLLSWIVDQLDPEETVVMALLLLVAGHETTANLIANSVVALHEHPDFARQLRSDPSSIGPAVDELLRWESPVQLTGRVATAAQQVGDVEVGAGEQVFISIGAANRDPSAFEDPGALRTSRPGPPHLAFGHGAHFCAGASLARSEATHVLEALLRLDPRIEDRQLSYTRGSSATFRRFEKLTLS
jgi:cytochrome P450